ncbi:MAG: hypothetical protein ACE5H9_06310 [Anaerolineae bacterium]
MRHRSYELWYALMAIVLITFVYGWVVIRLSAVPASSGLFGHLLGVAGFVLMLMTETLYSLRKRSHRARWGRMAVWLQFHIFTGLVGPYMVLLHTAWQFKGLAGLVALLTGVVVLSGFIGRYIYTAVPRTADGVELAAEELDRQIAAAEAELQRRLAASPEASRALPESLVSWPQVSSRSAWSLVLGRAVMEWSQRWQWWREKGRLDGEARAQAKALKKLLDRRRLLRRQRASLAMTRRLLALWHAVHVPLGMVLFTAAFIHIGAAIFYATLLR